MTQIKIYQPSAHPLSELVSLVTEKYGDVKNFPFFLSEYHKSLAFCAKNKHIRFIPIAGYEQKKLVAHIALIIDSRLPSGEAFFGFFEMPEDTEVFQSMWEALQAEAKKLGISKVKGPVNGSIWHQYRCVKETDGSEYFKSELPTELYYYDMLKSVLPTYEAEYYSAYRENFGSILPLIRFDEEALNRARFRIKVVKNVTMEELIAVGELSKKTFHKNWGYVELSVNEFLQLYSSGKMKSQLYKLYLLSKGEEIIGFCGVTREDKTTLICKTICILPEYHGKGLGNALAYRVHAETVADGCTKMIYALIRKGNNVQNFPKIGAVIPRRYAAFEFELR